jgi:hypothetical protein
MTYETAVAALEAARHNGKLENIRQIVEEFERQSRSSDHWESSRLLLHACDVINSHDYGDPQGQAELLRMYARRALEQSRYASLEQELRLLAHLQHDYEGGNESWPEARLARSRRWLRALQQLAEASREAEMDSLPRLKPVPPAQNLPSGIALEHVTEGDTRNAYRSARDRNREDAEAFAVRWKLKQLRRIYEPLGAQYVVNAFARQPYNLLELKQLLNEYLMNGPEAKHRSTVLQPGSPSVAVAAVDKGRSTQITKVARRKKGSRI